MKRITKPHHKVRSKKSIFHGRTWDEAIKTCIGTTATTWGWQCGISAYNPPNDNEYYMWFWKDLKFFKIPIPLSLFGYIKELCIKRKFVP